MSKISLRVYTKEIESLIDSGQTDEAIAHCQYVLKQFPKYIDAYRLLGKVYLEGRRYTEASDIFRRLLSVIPDDFVANLGMSIIKEDENNLDSAIWHMERAFEFQPSNPAIQSELQRLRSRRDGVEPPKVRLTRGALVRMYERGELYPQAIAEIKTALLEDPKRIDLLTTLARVYYLNNQKVEAIETCIRLLSKLPFCFEANRILAEVLPSTSRPEDALVYKQRLNALDPYSAFLLDSVKVSNLVPDNAVLVERLDWQPNPGETQPQWAQSIGVTIDDQEGLPSIIEDFFDQSTGFTEQPQDSSPSTTDILESTDRLLQTPAIPGNEEEIPKFVSNAGWTVSHETTTESTAASLQEEAGEENDLEISPAEIPEWLQSLAPSDASTSILLDDEQQKLDTLAAILPATESSEQEDLTSQFPQDSSSAVVSALPFEEETTSQVMEEAMDNTSPFDDLPQEEEGLPDWLKDLADEEKIGENQEDTLLPNQYPVTDQNTAAPSDLDEAMAWLESLAARQGAGDETLTTPPELRKDSPPDWILDAGADTEQTTIGEKTVAYPEELETDAILEPLSSESDPPASIVPDQEMERGTAAPFPALEDETATNWFESLTASHDTDKNSLPEKESSPSTIPSSWITENPQPEMQEPELTNSFFDGTSKIHTDEKQVPEELPEWLKDIEQQPLAADELTDSLPDWLKEIESEETEELLKTESQPSVNDSWINEPDSASPPVENEVPSIPIEELPDWLKGLEEQPGAVEEDLLPASTTLNVSDQAGEQLLSFEEEALSLEHPRSSEIPVSGTFQEQSVVESSASVAFGQSPDVSEDVESAHQLLDSGHIETALEAYNRLIENNFSLDEIIRHLQEALNRYPIDIGLWQSLGDAFAKTNRLQEALNAYTKAEELLK